MFKSTDFLADRLKGIKVNGEELTPDKFIDLIKSEDEHEAEASNVSIFTDEQLNQLKENIGKESASKGAKTLIEMEVKKYRNDLGLNFEGKTIDNLLNSYAEKIKSESKKTASEREKELQLSLESLQNKYKSDIETKESELSGLKKQMKNKELETLLIGSVPQNLNGVKPRQAAALFRMEYDLDYDENGGILVKQDGKIIKDNLENPVKYSDVFTNYLNSNNWLKQDGRGGGNQNGGNTGSDFKDINDVFKHLEKNKIDPGSPEGQDIINKFNKSQE